MDALIVLIAMVAVLVLFDFDVLRWDFDLRDRITANWLHKDVPERGL